VFFCPLCGRRCRYLFLRERATCRLCARLDYRWKNSAIGYLARIIRLRGKLRATARRLRQSRRTPSATIGTWLLPAR
jgi:hypothetical protein